MVKLEGVMDRKGHTEQNSIGNKETDDAHADVWFEPPVCIWKLSHTEKLFHEMDQTA